MEYIIEAYGLTKIVNKKPILTNINFGICKGKIFGLLGPNGAEKTTLMKLITNLLKPTSGSFQCFGEEVGPTDQSYLGRIGIMIDTPLFEEKMTAYQNLQLHVAYLGYNRRDCITKTLEMVGLNPYDKRKVKSFSMGMRQRLGIARAIITKPELLILDEPINGLDPNGIRDIRLLLQHLSQNFGTSILISSHILSELEQLVQEIAILQQGKIKVTGDMKEILAKQAASYTLKTADVKRTCILLERYLRITNYKLIDDQELRIYDITQPSSEIIKLLVQHNIPINSFTEEKIGLEEYFIHETEVGEIYHA